MAGYLVAMTKGLHHSRHGGSQGRTFLLARLLTQLLINGGFAVIRMSDT
jgi:hypothetical protein